jgi:hypothetical protein
MMNISSASAVVRSHVRNEMRVVECGAWSVCMSVEKMLIYSKWQTIERKKRAMRAKQFFKLITHIGGRRKKGSSSSNENYSSEFNYIIIIFTYYPRSSLLFVSTLPLPERLGRVRMENFSFITKQFSLALT